MGRIPRLRGRHHPGRASDLDAGRRSPGASAVATSTRISASTTRPTPSAPSPTAASTSRSAETPVLSASDCPWLHLKQTGRGVGSAVGVHTPRSSWGSWTARRWCSWWWRSVPSRPRSRSRSLDGGPWPPTRPSIRPRPYRRRSMRRWPRCGRTPASSATRRCGPRSSRRSSSSVSSSGPPPSRSASTRRPSCRRRRTSSMPGSTRSTRRCARSSAVSARWWRR